MKRVLFSTASGNGYVNPLVGVAQVLKQRDCHVGWRTFPRTPPQLAALGFELMASNPPAARGGQPSPQAGAATTLEQLRWKLEVMPTLIDGMRSAFREFRPDVMVVDGMQYASVIAAHLEGIPYANVCRGLQLLVPEDFPFDTPWTQTIPILAQQRAALFERFGLAPEFRLMESVSPHANVVFATAAFDAGRGAIPSGTALVGAGLPHGPRGDEVEDFPWTRLRSGSPLVYATLGSMHTLSRFFETLIEVARNSSGVFFVLAGRELADKDPRPLPSNVLTTGYAPQLALLSRASVCISHGGSNTVTEALHYSVPQLIVPLTNDHHLQAHLVRAAGVGMTLSLSEFEPEACAAALQVLLAPDSEYRRAARVLGESYVAHEGAREAAAVVLQLAGN